MDNQLSTAGCFALTGIFLLCVVLAMTAGLAWGIGVFGAFLLLVGIAGASS